MRFVSVLIFAVAMWGFQFGMKQSFHNFVKKETLEKVDAGLGSLSVFTGKLNHDDD